MTYHSDMLAFKKSELLAVLQAIDESFSFEVAILAEPDTNELVSSGKQDSVEYNKILFKKPLLSIYEAACIISGVGLYLVLACNDEYDSKITYPNWGGALDYIKTCVKEGLLTIEGSTRDHIRRDALKAFLASEGIIVEGFNNNLESQPLEGYGHSSVQKTEPNIENLNVEIARLNKLVAAQNIEIEQLKRDIEKERGVSFVSWVDQNNAETEVVKLKERIKELELEQSTEQLANNNLLELIFDETISDRYAPDLALAIRLWEDLYISNPRGDSHSNKANLWIDANTGYGDTSKSKLREITTPFINWSTHRDKNYKK